MLYDIFLSHCREDKGNVAFPLYRALDAVGFNVWIDRQSIVPGGNIYTAIKAAIQNSTCVIAVIAAPYLERRWTQQELQMTLELEKGERNSAHRLFPIYHGVVCEQVSKVFPPLRERAFEVLETECFDISDTANRIILDRVVLWFFTRDYAICNINKLHWLNDYLSRPHMNQLRWLLEACRMPTGDLRFDLIEYTNAIRYLLAILYEASPLPDVAHHLDIASKYCSDVATYCFNFRSTISYDMFLSCRSILYSLLSNLKFLLDST